MVIFKLLLAFWVILHVFLSSPDIIFAELGFSKNSFSNTISDKHLEQDQPDLVLKCLQRLSADDTRR